MDAKLKAAWIDALRSGEYRQGHRRLQTDDKYCCLGVLCEVSEKLGLAKAARFDNGVLEGAGLFYQPREIRNEILPIHTSELIEMNDGGKFFHDIADFIEANVPVSHELTR